MYLIKFYQTVDPGSFVVSTPQKWRHRYAAIVKTNNISHGRLYIPGFRLQNYSYDELINSFSEHIGQMLAYTNHLGVTIHVVFISKFVDNDKMLMLEAGMSAYPMTFETNIASAHIPKGDMVINNDFSHPIYNREYYSGLVTSKFREKFL